MALPCVSCSRIISGLKHKPPVSYVGDWQTDRFSLQSFGEVIFQQSKWSVAKIFQLLWRYGFWNLDRMRKFIGTLLSNFGL